MVLLWIRQRFKWYCCESDKGLNGTVVNRTHTTLKMKNHFCSPYLEVKETMDNFISATVQCTFLKIKILTRVFLLMSVWNPMHQLHLVFLFIFSICYFQNNNLSILKFRRKKLFIFNFLSFQQRFTNMIYRGLMKVRMIS